MTETEFSLQNFPEKPVGKQRSLEERLVLSYQGMHRFNEAITLTRDRDDPSDMEDQLAIAESMVEVGIAPIAIEENLKALDTRLQESVIRIPPGDPDSIIPEHLGKIQVLFGNYDALANFVRPSDTEADLYLYAAGIQINRGEDPSTMLVAAETLLKEVETKTAESRYPIFKTYHTPSYIRIARLYAQVGNEEEARRLFSQVEQDIDRVRNTYNETFQTALKMEGNASEAMWKALTATGGIPFDNDYEYLAMNLADSGMVADALRIAREMKREELPGYQHALEHVAKVQLAEGLTAAAKDTAQEVSDLFYTKLLARVLAHESRNTKKLNKDYFQGEYENDLDPALLEFFVEDNQDLMEIVTLVGEAAVHGGEVQIAQTYFKEAQDIIGWEEDMMMKPLLLLTFAKAIDEAGFDASSSFEEVFIALRTMIPEDKNPEWQERGPHADIKWSVWAEAIRELSKRGYFNLAEEYTNGFTLKSGSYDMSKARLVAELAAAEVKSGLSMQEIRELSAQDIENILRGNNHAAREAMLYFQNM